MEAQNDSVAEGEQIEIHTARYSNTVVNLIKLPAPNAVKRKK